MTRRFTKSTLAGVASVLLVAASMAGASARPAPRHPTSAIDWLALINHYRAQAGLPPVTEDHEWSDAALKHSTFIVKEDYLDHGESTDSPYYTPEGDAASNNAILFGDHVGASERYLTSFFLRTPIHGLSLITANQSSLGYGYYTENLPENSYGSGITIVGIPGRTGSPPDDFFPVVWPGEGSAVPFTTGAPELPTPTGYCSNIDGPQWGLPVIFQFARDPAITQASLTQDGVPIPHCILDSGRTEGQVSTYLEDFKAALLVAVDPLEPGSTYAASVTTARGETATTSFSVTPYQTRGCNVVAIAGENTGGPFVTWRDNNYAPGSYAGVDFRASVQFGDGATDFFDVVAGSEPNTFTVKAPHTYQETGTYEVEVDVTDPFDQRFEILGEVQVVAPGSPRPTPEACIPPANPPAPAYPPIRPAAPTSGGPSEDPSTDPGNTDEYRTSLTFKLTRHLKARGVLTASPANAACTVGQTVAIERLTSSGWKTVKTATTDSTGLFKAKLRDKPGRYHADFEGFSIDGANACLDVFSRTVRHTH